MTVCVVGAPSLDGTAVMVILAPKCFGSAAMVSSASAEALNTRS